MVQSLIGGATSYEEQSLKDILEDISEWTKYTQEIHSEIDNGIKELESSGFWNKVCFGFQMTLVSSLKCQDTYLHDFALIDRAIKEDRVTERGVRILRKMGNKAVEFNNEYGRTFKEERGWRDYGNPDFEVAEDLYKNGRDYFVTLQDASNATSRLQDYINTLPSITNNNISQSINGNSNIVTGINNGEINCSSIDKEEFSIEAQRAISRIRMLEGYEEDTKAYIEKLLKDSLEAVKGNDLEKQKVSEASFKALISGLGKNADKIIDIMASLTGIASFFGIGALNH